MKSTSIDPETIGIAPRVDAGAATHLNHGVSASAQSQSTLKHETLSGDLYRLHGFRLLDVEGTQVGFVDWIWANSLSGHGEFIGVQLHWLRGTVRVIPAAEVHVDLSTSTVRVSHNRDRIKRAPRYSINHTLSADQKRDIYSHYGHSRASSALARANQNALESVSRRTTRLSTGTSV